MKILKKKWIELENDFNLLDKRKIAIYDLFSGSVCLRFDKLEKGKGTGDKKVP